MEYQTVPANDLKPGDDLLNHGKILSVKLTAKEVTIVLQPHKAPMVLGSLQESHTTPSDWYISELTRRPHEQIAESVLGYNEPMTIQKRPVDMTDLAMHKFGQLSSLGDKIPLADVAALYATSVKKSDSEEKKK